MIFRQYLALGCVAKLRAELDERGIRSKQRVLTCGRVLGGCWLGHGALYHLLRNRIYRGEVVHKGISCPGTHKAIVNEEMWNGVQARLAENRMTRRKSWVESGALLGGLIYDDRGNIMSPTYSVRRGNRYRYYISSALLDDRKASAGTRARVNADNVERLMVEVLCRELSRPKPPALCPFTTMEQRDAGIGARRGRASRCSRRSTAGHRHTSENDNAAASTAPFARHVNHHKLRAKISRPHRVET
jgi:hypothetical protein